jgi:hypothetical protein
MSRLTYTLPCLTVEFVLPPSNSNPGHTHKRRIHPPEAGPVQIKNAMGNCPDNGRAPLLGGKRQPTSAWGA